MRAIFSLALFLAVTAAAATASTASPSTTTALWKVRADRIDGTRRIYNITPPEEPFFIPLLSPWVCEVSFDDGGNRGMVQCMGPGRAVMNINISCPPGGPFDSVQQTIIGLLRPDGRRHFITFGCMIPS